MVAKVSESVKWQWMVRWVGGWYSRGGGGQRYSPPGDGVSMFASLQFAELAATMSTFFMHMDIFLVLS